jgi:hypothetical protein
MQAIHRFGGKITNISIQRLQLDLPRINSEVDSVKEQEHVLEKTPAIKIAPTVEPKEISEVIPEIIVTDVSVDISNNIPVQEPVAIAEIVSTPEPVVEVISEIVPEPISEQVVENAKPLTKAAVKPKKSRTSTKAHGFSRKESSPQIPEPVAITEIVPVPEPVVEVISAIVLEPISEQVVENAKPLAEAVVKPKKSRTSTKGFSKKESSPQIPEPVAITEVVPVTEPVVEIIPEIAPEPVAIAEVVPVPEPVVEIIPEISPEQVSDSATSNSSDQDLKQIELTSDHVTEAVLDSTLEPMLETSVENDFEVTEPVSNVEITIESAVPLPPSKSKKSKTSSKSGSGFNKLKSDTAPQSQRKPKI